MAPTFIVAPIEFDVTLLRLQAAEQQQQQQQQKPLNDGSLIRGA
jgi:hypothetical protein